MSAFTAYRVTPTANASAGVKGSYTQVVASSPYDSSRLHLTCLWTSSAWVWTTLDIALGGAGAESVIVSNIMSGQDTEALSGWTIPIDVDIPAGSRIAVRVAASTGSQPLNIGIHLE